MAARNGGMALVQGVLMLALLEICVSQEAIDVDPANSVNCTTTENLVFHAPNVSEEAAVAGETLSAETKVNVNASHLKTFTLPAELGEAGMRLTFPNISGDNRYKMASLHLDKGIFVFDFLRNFLSFVQPFDVPADLLRDVVENKVTATRLLSQSMHAEATFMALAGVCCILACVIPGTELWLACSPIRKDYKPPRRPGVLAFFLAFFVFLMGSCMLIMIACNEAIAAGVSRLPVVAETVLQDLGDYHTGTTVQLRKSLTRSLDVASEAILGDLDEVEELLGKPVQEELSSETGLDVALDALLDVANATRELSSRTEALLKEGERAREQGVQLSHETDSLRRELESATRACPATDRSLCAILDPTGLHLALRLERLLKDDRLQRLRGTERENLMEASRQVRGEYLYVPHHVARTTLDARNQIRKEISEARSKIFDEAKNIEASSSELSRQLQVAREILNKAIPPVAYFEEICWFVGLGTVICVFLVWLLIVGALCCRCGSTESRVRPTLLCAVLVSCIVSVALWAVVVATLAISSHAEMLICRPLHDPEYRTLEVILESRTFLGRPLTVPLKNLFEKCRQNDAAYPAFQLGSSTKLELFTAHWTWPGLSKALSKLKVDLKGLRILTPQLQQRLQSLLYAASTNITEYRIMIQGPVLKKDLGAFSDELENVARQVKDRRTARDLEIIASSTRTILARRIKPLMKLQDALVYQLTALEFLLQPLQRQVNQSISHLKTIQYYIDNQGQKIAQLKTKAYVDRFSGYLNQWRRHVLLELGTGVAKCKPLWDILHGVRLLLCQHILGPLNGFWFATISCAIIMMASTPMAHSLASVYRKEISAKETGLLPERTESPDTIVIDRNTWRTPEPPPPQDSW